MKIKKIIFLMLLLAIVLTVPGPTEMTLLAGNIKSPLTIVVDAGHGGPDGGAEAADGTHEADLNLAIATALKEEAKKRGIKVIMTRTTEEGLYSEENIEKKWSKLEDMKCRKTIIETTEADIALSIHMNCFQTDTSVRGAQVFYPKTGNAKILADSEVLAESVQTALVKGIADGSNRKHMGRGEIYLMENPRMPTVLVECGFLSNSVDLERLKQKKEQQKIAMYILEGVLTYTEI